MFSLPSVIVHAVYAPGALPNVCATRSFHGVTNLALAGAIKLSTKPPHSPARKLRMQVATGDKRCGKDFR